jgi:hypothetical protein
MNIKRSAFLLIIAFCLCNSICFSQRLKPARTQSGKIKTSVQFSTVDSVKYLAEASKLIRGTWEGQFEKRTITLIFNLDNTAALYFKGYENIFNYRFLSPHIVMFDGGFFKAEQYFLQTLTPSALHFIKYPIQDDRESISIYETIDFVKK